MESSIRLVNLIDESFVEYRKAHMLLAVPFCSFKCDLENGKQLCQNWELRKDLIKTVNIEDLVNRYLSNYITEAIVFAGLEPFDSFPEVLSFVDELRSRGCLDDVVIYTGYYPKEIADSIAQLQTYPNIIVKFGRYRPGFDKHLDSVLGISLASPNQYAMKIS